MEPKVEYWKRGTHNIGKEATPSSPALVAIDERFALLVHRGVTGNSLRAHLYDAQLDARWIIGGDIKGKAKTKPTAVLAMGRVHVFHQGESSDHTWWCMSPEVASGPDWWRGTWNESQLPLKSSDAPAAVWDPVGNRIVLVTVGDSLNRGHRISWSTIDSDHVLTDRGSIARWDFLHVHPTLVAHEGAITLYLTTDDATAALPVVTDPTWGFQLAGDEWSPAKNAIWYNSTEVLVAQKRSHADGPIGAAVYRRRIHVMRTRSDHGVEWFYAEPSGWTSPLILPNSIAEDNPALCTVGDRMLAVWNYTKHAPTLGPYVDFDERFVWAEYQEPRPPEPLRPAKPHGT